MKDRKRVFAIIGIVLLLLLYLVSFISALLVTPYSNALFQASVFSTIAIPIFVYCLVLVYKVLKKRNEDDNRIE